MREREAERCSGRENEREKQRDGVTERMRDRENERQRDGVTERMRDTEIEENLCS
jgi:hypothetical protein